MAGLPGWTAAPSTSNPSNEQRFASQPSTPSSSASAFGLGRAAPAPSQPVGLEAYPLYVRGGRRGSVLSTEVSTRLARHGNDSGEVSDDLLGTLDDDDEMADGDESD